MTRKERVTGLNIKEWLTHAISHGEITAEDMYEALGMSRATFYRYIKEGRDGTFPNEEEIDLLVSNLKLTKRFGLTASEIKVRFGVITIDDLEEARERVQELEEMEHLLVSPPVVKTRKGVRAKEKAARNVKDVVRRDAAPL